MMTASLKRNDFLAGNTDTGFLKILALLFMITDHVGAIFFPKIMELRIIGRIAFPLYAWCLVVGSVKTKNPLKYALRLLGLAIVSQPLYMMALNHTWRDFNILFTLLLALIAIQGIRAHFLGSEIWVPALCYFVLGFINVDYGWKGITFIILLYLARNSRSGLVSTFLAYILFWGASSSQVTRILGWKLPFLKWPGMGTALSAFFRLQGMAWLALPFISLRTRTSLRMPRWLGYAAYPLHLVVLILVMLFGGTPFVNLLQVF